MPETGQGSRTTGLSLQMDAATVRRWCAAAVDALGAHRDEIDALNVFPVPDGDTGTNMLLTLRATAEALRRERPTQLATAAAVMARGALLGARGNSGVILSQIVRGMTEVLGQMDPANAPSADDLPMPRLLAQALKRGAELARSAVSEPVEGTILTVADAAAAAALLAATDATIDMAGVALVATAASAAAAKAVASTPDLLPALARAGVVDAGGRGLSVILDALAAVTGGTPAGGESWARSISATTREAIGSDHLAHDRGSSDYAYEVVYLLDSAPAAIGPLEAVLRALGDSLVMVSAGSAGAQLDDAGTTTWKIHVHVNDVGAAIEAGVEAGRPHEIAVTRFEDQIGGRIQASLRGVGVVAISPGEGLTESFEAEGVVVVDCGPARRPSTADVLKAIVSTGAAHVVVLPNDRDCAAVADAAAGEARTEGYDVAVVSTKSVVQGLSAVAVHDPERRFADNVIAMAEAAAGTRFADVTVAVRDALTMAGPCHAGDVLGLVDSEVAIIGSSVLEVALDLLDRLLSTGGELVTVIVAHTAPNGVADDLQRDIHSRHPEIEVTVFAGGPADHPLLLGVE